MCLQGLTGWYFEFINDKFKLLFEASKTLKQYLKLNFPLTEIWCARTTKSNLVVMFGKLNDDCCNSHTEHKYTVGGCRIYLQSASQICRTLALKKEHPVYWLCVLSLCSIRFSQRTGHMFNRNMSLNCLCNWDTYLQWCNSWVFKHLSKTSTSDQFVTFDHASVCPHRATGLNFIFGNLSSCICFVRSQTEVTDGSLEPQKFSFKIYFLLYDWSL